MDWDTLANIATVIAAIAATIELIVITVALIYGYAELRESARSRNLAATMEMIHLIGSEKVK